jgi:predicted  nucleic acid-binding Zn-ribbon protein
MVNPQEERPNEPRPAEPNARREPPRPIRVRRSEEDDENPILDKPRGYGGNGGKTSILPFAIVIVVAVLLSYAWLGLANGGKFVTQKSDELNWSGFDARVDGRIDTKWGSFSDKITSIDSRVATSEVKTAEINNNVSNIISRLTALENNPNSNLQAQINALTTEIVNIKSLMANVDNTNTAIVADIANIKSRLEKLEETVNTSSGATSNAPFTVETRIINKNISFDASTNATTLGFGVKVILANGSVKDLEDIELAIPMSLSMYTSYGSGQVGVWSESSSKWYLTDRDYGYDEAFATLVGTDITLDKSDTEKITVGMSVVISGEVQDFDVDIDDGDIEIEWGYE